MNNPMKPDTLARRSAERIQTAKDRKRALLARLYELAQRDGPDSIFAELYVQTRNAVPEAETPVLVRKPSDEPSANIIDTMTPEERKAVRAKCAGQIIGDDDESVALYQLYRCICGWLFDRQFAENALRRLRSEQPE